MLIVKRQARCQVGRKVGLELETKALALIVGAPIAIIPISVVDDARDPHCAGLAERDVDGSFARECVIITILHRPVAGKLAELWLGWQNVNRARCGVSAVQRALRALEDLNPIGVEKRCRRGSQAPDVDPVVIERDCGIACHLNREIADAADEGGRRWPDIGDRQRRNEVVQPFWLGDAVVDKVRTADHIDSDRGSLGALGASLRRYDDVAQTGRIQFLCVWTHVRRTLCSAVGLSIGRFSSSYRRRGSAILRQRCSGDAPQQDGRTGQDICAHFPSSFTSSRRLCC